MKAFCTAYMLGRGQLLQWTFFREGVSEGGETQMVWADRSDVGLRGSRASRKASPKILNESTVTMIKSVGGQINQGCSTITAALVARESILPQEASGC